MSNLVLEPREFKLLDGLRLNPRKSFGVKVRGERLTKKKGISIEFADFREYAEGDDLRHLDWNVLARLDSPVMRTYRDEEDLAVHILLDGSASMSFGEPTKFSGAVRLACALGYVALCGGDAVVPRILGMREPNQSTLRGRSSFPRLVNWANQSRDQEAAKDSLSTSIRQFVSSSTRTGLVCLFTDGLDPELPTSIRGLGGRGHEVLLLQILSDIELDPDLEGDLRLIDVELGTSCEITANGQVLKEYRRRLAAHNQELSDAVLRVGGRYALVHPQDSVEQLIQRVWKKQGWMR